MKRLALLHTRAGRRCNRRAAAQRARVQGADDAQQLRAAGAIGAECRRDCIGTRRCARSMQMRPLGRRMQADAERRPAKGGQEPCTAADKLDSAASCNSTPQVASRESRINQRASGEILRPLRKLVSGGNECASWHGAAKSRRRAIRVGCDRSERLGGRSASVCAGQGARMFALRLSSMGARLMGKTEAKWESAPLADTKCARRRVARATGFGGCGGCGGFGACRAQPLGPRV